MRAVLSVVLLLGCVPIQGDTRAQPRPIPLVGRSLNRSDVDVYLLCGDRDARLLGTIGPRETAALEISAAEARCVWGLNLFLVVRRQNRGHWVGPFRPRIGAGMELVVEKYAGLSSIRINEGWR